MNTYIALFRGINVGGRNILPMKELTAVLEELGLVSIRTYIQSGNVVFQTAADRTRKLAGKISAAVGKSHGFIPQVLVLSIQELQNAIDSNPFPEGNSEPKTLHLFFLETEPAKPDLARLTSRQASSERFKLVGTVFYLHAPEGIGRSKLAAIVEKALGVTVTARNWRSANAILSLALKDTS
jgi:uncharacterized protein (DUF1697 family)